MLGLLVQLGATLNRRQKTGLTPLFLLMLLVGEVSR